MNTRTQRTRSIKKVPHINLKPAQVAVTVKHKTIRKTDGPRPSYRNRGHRQRSSVRQYLELKPYPYLCVPHRNW